VQPKNTPSKKFAKFAKKKKELQERKNPEKRKEKREKRNKTMARNHHEDDRRPLAQVRNLSENRDPNGSLTRLPSDRRIG
jgi:hypothetical protein